MSTIPDVLFLVGPTGIGKSEIAMKLAARLRGEIISADSMQVYRGMDIGTAKPSRAERRKIRHHLIDSVRLSQPFSVYAYRKRALRALRDVLSRHRIPIVVGGSGLYVRALLEGLSEQPGADVSYRKKLEQSAHRDGLETLHGQLRGLDAKAAAKIKPTDRKRIIRALEIIHRSGRTPSEWHAEKIPLTALGMRPVVFGIRQARPDLYDRINRRVIAMMRKGWIAEVKRLRPLRWSKTAAQAVGYKEIRALLSREKPPRRLSFQSQQEALIASIQRQTRRLAKRQMTWFKREKGIQWIDWEQDESAREVCDKIMKEYNRHKEHQ